MAYSVGWQEILYGSRLQIVATMRTTLPAIVSSLLCVVFCFFSSPYLAAFFQIEDAKNMWQVQLSLGLIVVATVYVPCYWYTATRVPTIAYISAASISLASLILAYSSFGRTAWAFHFGHVGIGQQLFGWPLFGIYGDAGVLIEFGRALLILYFGHKLLYVHNPYRPGGKDAQSSSWKSQVFRVVLYVAVGSTLFQYHQWNWAPTDLKDVVMTGDSRQAQRSKLYVEANDIVLQDPIIPTRIGPHFEKHCVLPYVAYLPYSLINFGGVFVACVVTTCRSTWSARAELRSHLQDRLNRFTDVANEGERRVQCQKALDSFHGSCRQYLVFPFLASLSVSYEVFVGVATLAGTAVLFTFMSALVLAIGSVVIVNMLFAEYLLFYRELSQQTEFIKITDEVLKTNLKPENVIENLGKDRSRAKQLGYWILSWFIG